MCQEILSAEQTFHRPGRTAPVAACYTIEAARCLQEQRLGLAVSLPLFRAQQAGENPAVSLYRTHQTKAVPMNAGSQRLEE
jgi:hypothetical protein